LRADYIMSTYPRRVLKFFTLLQLYCI
jgi:hypothetical protein